ncbi:MAG TPA: hypothetical protein VKU36_04440 [Candidatus Babeliales bacterium]|nr:hypothetical protein [Candidatus Babeliales bacterium]
MHIFQFILLFSHVLTVPLHAQYGNTFYVKESWGTNNTSSRPTKSPSSQDGWNNPRNSPCHTSRNFNNFRATDFQRHFQDRGLTEKEILQQPCLYMFDEFVKFAQTYSSYTCTIQQLHAELKKLNIIQKAYYFVQGTYCWGLQKRIHYLYNQLSTLKNNNDVVTGPTISMETYQLLKQLSAQQAEYKALDGVYRAYAPSLSNVLAQRTDAYRTMTSNDTLQYVSKSYNLNNNVKHLLTKYGHDTARFTQCYGNQLDQAIHQESLDLLDRIDTLPSSSFLYDQQEALVDFTVAMVDYNHENLTDKAMNIADLCWTLLDYGQAIAEGAALGAYTAVTDLVNNPIEATINIVAGKQILAYQLTKVLYNVADISVTALSNFDKAKDKWNKYTEPLNNIIDAISKKEITIRDAIKSGTAFVVGYKAQGKLLGGLGKFCNTIKNKSINFVKNNTAFNPKEYLATPEGLLFKATADSNKLKQSGQNTASSLTNKIENSLKTPEFIQQNRIPLDRETILHNELFKKTKITPVKGAQVYNKDNLFYHRDTFHKGKGAHLEVYNKQGIHLGEANPLTGQLIPNTADKNKKLNF